jgi:hypothetical protein
MDGKIHRTVGNTSTGNAPVRGVGQKVRIFVGTEPKTEIARKVLECSIRRRTDSEVEITPMIGPKWEYDTKGFKQGTGFSLRRWMIPEFCKWHGRAIYLDSDQLVFSDIWDLWSQPDYNPIPGCAAWMTYQPSKFSNKPHPNSSVMVLDCARAEALPYFHIGRAIEFLKENPSRDAYADLMFPNWIKPEPGKIGTEWNSLNVYAAGKTKLLHYTKEPEQPWYVPDHPFAMRWQMEFQIALNLGYITEEEVVDAVARFGIKEDWRTTNGLHPFYLRYIKTPEGKARAKGLGLTLPKPGR